MLGQEPGIFVDEAGTKLAVTWVVDSITVEPKCDGQFQKRAENRPLVALHFRVATLPGADLNTIGFTGINPADFSYIGADGLTVSNVATEAAYPCLADKEQLSNQMAPGQKYAGTIVLDVQGTHGILTLYSAITGGGWEWKF